MASTEEYISIQKSNPLLNNDEVEYSDEEIEENDNLFEENIPNLNRIVPKTLTSKEAVTYISSDDDEDDAPVAMSAKIRPQRKDLPKEAPKEIPKNIRFDVGDIDDEQYGSKANSDSESESEEDEDNVEELDDGVESQGVKRLWQDEEDDNILYEDEIESYSVSTYPQRFKKKQKYSSVVREKYLEVYSKPIYSFKPKEEDSNLATDLQKRAGMFKAKSTSLPSQYLANKRCKDLNFESRAKGQIVEVQFHPTATLAMVVSNQGSIDLFQVDGKVNSLLPQGIKFGKAKIGSAKFTPDGHKIIAADKNDNFLYCYDLLSEKIFNIPGPRDNFKGGLHNLTMSAGTPYMVVAGNKNTNYFMSSSTHEVVGHFVQNTVSRAFQFTQNGEKLYSNGDSEYIHLWDVNARRCIKRFSDKGIVKGSSLALSPDERFLATGSKLGLVNLYETVDLIGTSPEPIKSFSKMNCMINRLKFNSTSEILGMCGAYEDDSLRLAHVGKQTLFVNFPQGQVSIASTFDFSLNSGYFATGLKNGCVQLYRLNHYERF